MLALAYLFLFIVLSITVVYIAYGPDIVTMYTDGKVEPASVRVGYRGIILHGVKVKTNSVKAYVDTVVVPWDSSLPIRVSSGYGVVTKVDGKTSSRKRRKIHAEFDSLIIRYKGKMVRCAEVSYKDGVLTSESCFTSVDGAAFVAKDVEYASKTLRVKELSVSYLGAVGVFSKVGYRGGVATIGSGVVRYGDTKVKVGLSNLSRKSMKIDMVEITNRSVSKSSVKLSNIIVDISMPSVVVHHKDYYVIVDVKDKTADVVIPKCSSIVFDLPEVRSRVSHVMGSLRVKLTKSRKLVFHDLCSLQLSNLPMKYMPYKPDGKERFEREVYGMDWVSLNHISKELIDAVVRYEDPGFWNHAGYSPTAYTNALRIDLKEKRFAVGASTITMQVAKNLFLSRDKTIIRKVSEFFLAKALEGSLSKEGILELYFNIIEFAPGCYGIRCFLDKYGMLPSEVDAEFAKKIAIRIRNPKRTLPDAPMMKKVNEDVKEEFNEYVGE